MKRNLVFSVALAIGLALTGTAFAKGPAYPMKPPEYRKLVEKRLDGIWAGMEKKLDFHNVTPDRKKAIKKMFDDATHEVWVEVVKASSDGAISKDEATRIRGLTNGVRGKVRSKMAQEKSAEKAAAAEKSPDKPEKKLPPPKPDEPKKDKANPPSKVTPPGNAKPPAKDKAAPGHKDAPAARKDAPAAHKDAPGPGHKDASAPGHKDSAKPKAAPSVAKNRTAAHRPPVQDSEE